MMAAKGQFFNVKGKAVKWEIPEPRKCNNCQSEEHIARQCPNNTKTFRNPFIGLYDKFRPAQYRPRNFPKPIPRPNNQPLNYAEAAKRNTGRSPDNTSMHETSQSNNFNSTPNEI